MAQGGRATVERRIRFYRLQAGRDEQGREVSFDPLPALQGLEALRPQARYSGGQDEPLTGSVGRFDSPPRVEFGRSRRDAIPVAELNGEQRALAVEPGWGILEAIHLVFFPGNIVGAEFNFYGPRAQAFASFMSHVVPRQWPSSIKIEPLLRHDAQERLRRLSGIKVLDLKVSSSYLGALQEADDNLYATFDNAQRLGQAQTVSLTLTPEPYSQKGRLRQGLLAAVRSLARRPDLEDGVLRFNVKGDGPDGLEVIDVLSDQLIASAHLVRLSRRSRAVMPDSAYEAIEAAHQNLGDTLPTAPAIG